MLSVINTKAYNIIKFMAEAKNNTVGETMDTTPQKSQCFGNEQKRLEFAMSFCQFCVHDKNSPYNTGCPIIIAQKLYPPEHYAHPQEIRLDDAGELVCDKFALGECWRSSNKLLKNQLE